MMTLHVDLGQLIIICAMAIIGYLLKQEVSDFKQKLSKHEDIILGLVSDVQRLIGYQQGWNGGERRKDGR